METDAIKLAYEVFSTLMTEDRLFLDKDLTYSHLCRWIGVPEKELDSYIESELGLSGAEIMKTFRTREPEHLRKKYSSVILRIQEAQKGQKRSN